MGLSTVVAQNIGFPRAAFRPASDEVRLPRGWPVPLKVIEQANLERAWLVAAQIFPEDYGVIYRAFSASAMNPGRPPGDQAEEVQWLRYYEALDKNDEPLGITGLTQLWHEPYAAWVDWLGVDPDEQRKGRGYGRRTMDATKLIATGRRYRHLRLWTTDEKLVEGFYRREGFVPQPTKFKDDGKPIIICNYALDGSSEPEPYRGDKGKIEAAFCGVMKRITYG
jgi:GNAT superfamily N-acetyltransferase